MYERPPLVRDLDAEHYLEAFLVSTVASIVVIRVGLELTGYPQLGGGGLHIAHMLWGGLLLAVVLLTLLSTLNTQVKGPAAVVGGMGFGIFIDELGKFLTRDNDYFFQPTFAIIYVLLMVIFLVWRWLDRRNVPSDSEYLANAIAKMHDAVIGDLDEEEQRVAQSYLARCNPADPMVRSAQAWFADMEAVAAPSPSWYARFKRRGRRTIERLLDQRGVVAVVITTFVVATLVQGLAPIGEALLRSRPDASSFGHVEPGLMSLGQIVSTAVSALLVLVGVIRLPRNRISAYRLFRTALLVSLLVTQFFRFYQRPLVALGSLTLDLLLLFAIGQLLERERASALARGAATIDSERA